MREYMLYLMNIPFYSINNLINILVAQFSELEKRILHKWLCDDKNFNKYYNGNRSEACRELSEHLKNLATVDRSSQSIRGYLDLLQKQGSLQSAIDEARNAAFEPSLLKVYQSMSFDESRRHSKTETPKASNEKTTWKAPASSSTSSNSCSSSTDVATATKRARADVDWLMEDWPPESERRVRRLQEFRIADDNHAKYGMEVKKAAIEMVQTSLSFIRQSEMEWHVRAEHLLDIELQSLRLQEKLVKVKKEIILGKDPEPWQIQRRNSLS